MASTERGAERGCSFLCACVSSICACNEQVPRVTIMGRFFVSLSDAYFVLNIDEKSRSHVVR